LIYDIKLPTLVFIRYDIYHLILLYLELILSYRKSLQTIIYPTKAFKKQTLRNINFVLLNIYFILATTNNDKQL
jgi:hypothetical protein